MLNEPAPNQIDRNGDAAQQRPSAKLVEPTFCAHGLQTICATAVRGGGDADAVIVDLGVRSPFKSGDVAEATRFTHRLVMTWRCAGELNEILTAALRHHERQAGRE